MKHEQKGEKSRSDVGVRNRCTAILLAAGQGRRMGSPIPKQYMPLCDRPLLSWSLAALASSDIITDIVLVIPGGDEQYVRTEILPQAENIAAHSTTGASAGNFASKARAFVPGGTERYWSVLNGLRAITWPCDYVFIHDGARPLIDQLSLQRLYTAVQDPANHGTAVAAVPSKDTVKITDDEGFVQSTPDRSHVWIIQTPQVFAHDLIRKAYDELAANLPTLTAAGIHVTDDAMLVETLCHVKVRLIEASYQNIKVTTPEDIPLAETLLRRKAFSA